MNLGLIRRKITIAGRRFRLGRLLMFALMISAVVAGFVTYAALTETQPLGKNPDKVVGLLLVDLCFFLLIGSVIARRIAKLVARQRQGRAGSRLHLRVIAIFSAIAVIPAIIVALFAAIFFIYGVQSWFSDRVRTAVDESREVARGYLTEHQKVIRGDILSMANDLNRAANSLSITPQQYENLLNAQAHVRSLSDALVFDGSGRILASSGLTMSLEFEPLSAKLLERARHGEVVIIVDDDNDRVRALMQIDRTTDMFLYVGRFVDQQVLDHMQAAEGAAAEYKTLESKRHSLQILVTAIFIVVALMLLAVAVWVGLNFANRLVGPISALIDAAERVTKGDWSAKVTERSDERAPDELTRLTRAFNRMTAQLASQQQELIAANRQLDTRRRFTEAVLSGVSAGVIGTDANRIITLPNQAAGELLGTSPDSLIGYPVVSVVPELRELLESNYAEGQIELQRDGQPRRTLLVRVTTEMARPGGEQRGLVITFDDVTDLVSAQRQAAWSDVARRIAHEIKNPLTPIQLSAERLQRRYLKEIVSDPDIFKSCTETIIRQVGDIGRMVDEFSAFARMPEPQMKANDLNEMIRETVFLMGNAKNTVAFTTDLTQPSPEIICDSRQISQALTNLMKNALEAIEGREGGNLEPGRIHVSTRLLPVGDVEIRITDNGRGLPKAERSRLTEPYVTTRSKGTGLGLAIVKKILEDHQGQLMLEDNEPVGAQAILRLPLHPESYLQVA